MAELPDYLLNPVSEEVRLLAAEKDRFCIGANVLWDTEAIEEAVKHKKVFLLSFPFDSNNQEVEDFFANRFRKVFYGLNAPGWDVDIIDLGDVSKGETFSDSIFALKEVLKWAGLWEHSRLVLLAPEASLNTEILKGYPVEEALDVTFVDLGIDLKPEQDRSTYLSEILDDQELDLSDCKFLGYQSYFTAPEVLDLMEQLHYTCLRLGEIVSDVTLLEPELRNTHYLSFDLRAIQRADMQFCGNTPNGFNAREVCALTRYAGWSDELKMISFFAKAEKAMDDSQALLMAEMIWYFLEGFHQSVKKMDFDQKGAFEKFMVLSDFGEITFFRDRYSDKWWLAIKENEERHEFRYVPCSREEYERAKRNELPDKFWKAFKKFF